MNWKKGYILIVLVAGAFMLHAQDYTQIVKGVVLNEATKLPISNVTVQLSFESQTFQINSNNEGSFKFDSIPVGRANMHFSKANYEPYLLEDIFVSTGREVVLNITLSESPRALKTVEVDATVLRNEPINRMAIASTYVLKIEEAHKMAGSLDDPMRLVTSYPGIVQLNSGFNSFTVRGNAPVGMLYRLEGIPIHNPNHFASIGSTGGFVTQFSSQLLTTSEFFASAYPAEFGNATTAVFDFKFRNGNKDKREHAAKINVLGVDFATEGPFKKGGKATYLFNYRYSSLGLLANAFGFSSIVPAYQDFSFNLNFPTKRLGVFKVFGIGGLSNLTIAAQEDSVEWEGNTNRVKRNLGSNSGAIGIVHYKPISTKGYWHSVIAASAGKYFDDAHFIEDDLLYTPRELNNYIDQRLTFTSDYNHRFSKRHVNKTGVILTHLNHTYFAAHYNKLFDAIDTTAQTSGAAITGQAFTQSKFNITDRLQLNVGLHFLYFDLNKQYSVEPRGGISYQLSRKSILSLAYGLHGRVEDLSYYFAEEKSIDGASKLLNENLKLLKSHQTVLRYAHMFNSNLKFTAEAYLQYLVDVPVDPNGTFSVQNLMVRFPNVSLENSGEGRNYGLELSLQRFTKNGVYFMITGALFNSEYKAGDGVWRNTEFDQEFSYNILGGKEFELKPKNNKKRLLGLNFNLRHSGGTWQNVVNEEASAIYGWTQYDLNNPYSDRQPSLVNFDFTLSLKGIRKNITGEFSIQIKNLFNSRTVLKREWDEKLGAVKEIKDYGTIPIIGYKIWF